MTETSSSHAHAHWAYRSAGELAQSLAKKEISALELTDQFIARIEALDGDLNARAGARFCARPGSGAASGCGLGAR